MIQHLITSCYPCPMCFGCAIEHNISKIHFCSSPKDAQTHGGFLDQMLWGGSLKRGGALSLIVQIHMFLIIIVFSHQSMALESL